MTTAWEMIKARVARSTLSQFTGDVTALEAGVATIPASCFSIRRMPSGQQQRIRLNASNERGSAGTYHATFQAAGDFYAVQPIINVTRAPTDATYTNNDVYDQIAVAPSATVLTGGYPDASGGAGAWTASANMTFARQAGASTTNPVPVLGSLMYCSSIARTDGGPGRLLMARAYSAGSGHAQAATTRMPTYYCDQIDLANCQRWDSETYGFPLAAMGQYYYRSGNYASTSQDSYGSGATRWANNCIVGVKFHYAKPTLTVLMAGDSIVGGDYDQTNIPLRASFGFRAGYSMQSQGYPIDIINAGGSGYRWDQFGPWMQTLVSQIKPDIVVLPIFSPNGTESGVGTGNAAVDVDKQWARAMYYRDWCLLAGVKEVVFLTPTPLSTKSVVIPALIDRLQQSGFAYADINAAVSAGNSYTWATNYSTDGTHPLAVANVAAATVLEATLKTYFF